MGSKKFKVTIVVRNTIANYAGSILTALVAFLFIPIYIRYLGIGSYGIIGFFNSLYVLIAFLDLGIGMAINREMSRHYHDASQVDYLRKLTHSLQIVYWAIGIGVGILLFALAPFFSKHWFAGNEIPQHTLFVAFAVLSLTLAVRWPYTVYSSAIRGMQYQVILNAHDVFWVLVKNIGSWVVLKYYSPTLSAFLWYQLIVTFLQTFSITIIVWLYMPAATVKKKLVFDKGVLKQISGYAAGLGAASLLGSIIMQLDKIIVSKMVNPSQFGYYMVASNVAILVYNASLPIYIAIFPHFAKLVHNKEGDRLNKDFHFYSNLLSTVLFPFSIIVFFAAEEVLWLWTKDKTLAHTAAPILKILIVGTTLNALLTTVHTLLLAFSRVKLFFYSHLIASFVMVPLALWLVHVYGVKGGAMSITFLYTGYFFIQAIVIFKKLGLQKLAFNWYFRDTLQSLVPVLVTVFLGTHYWLSSPATMTKADVLIKLSVIGATAYFVSVAFNESLRTKLLHKFFPRYRNA